MLRVSRLPYVRRFPDFQICALTVLPLQIQKTFGDAKGILDSSVVQDLDTEYNNSVVGHFAIDWFRLFEWTKTPKEKVPLDVLPGHAPAEHVALVKKCEALIRNMFVRGIRSRTFPLLVALQEVGGTGASSTDQGPGPSSQTGSKAPEVGGIAQMQAAGILGDGTRVTKYEGIPPQIKSGAVKIWIINGLSRLYAIFLIYHTYLTLLTAIETVGRVLGETTSSGQMVNEQVSNLKLVLDTLRYWPAECVRYGEFDATA